MPKQNESRQLIELLSSLDFLPVLATIAIGVILGFACGIGVIHSIRQHRYSHMAAWILLPYSGMGALFGLKFTGISTIVSDNYLPLFVIIHSLFLAFPLGRHYYQSNRGPSHFYSGNRDDHDIDPRPFERSTLHNQDAADDDDTNQ